MTDPVPELADLLVRLAALDDGTRRRVLWAWGETLGVPEASAAHEGRRHERVLRLVGLGGKLTTESHADWRRHAPE